MSSPVIASTSTLLELDQAAGVVGGADRLGLRREPDQVVQAGRADRRAHALAVEEVDAGDVGALADQDLLARVVVLGGERDLLPAVAVDGHVADDQVDLAVLEHLDPLGSGDHPQLVARLVAEDRLGHLATKSMSKPSIGAGHRVASPSR